MVVTLWSTVDKGQRRLAAASLGTAVAIALLLAALVAAGCGLGPGGRVGEAGLTVTRDYGARRLAAPLTDGVSESDTAMRLLERNARISTRYGGGFVQSIDGLEGAERSGRRYDWFFYVNGVEATVGAADYALRGGEAVWWDYRDWSAAIGAPAVVGSWPQPFAGGYDGRRRPVAVECMGGGGACDEVRQRLERAGVHGARGRTYPPHVGIGATAPGASGPRSSPAGAIRVLVGPWARLREDPAAAQIEAGPRQSGVFAEFRPAGGRLAGGSPAAGFALWGLDEGGKPARRFGSDAGLVAATRRYEAPPVWVVTGAGERGVRAAAGLLDSRDLRDHYAIVVDRRGKTEPLPLRPSRPGPGPVG
jgi:hypothetical protein